MQAPRRRSSVYAVAIAKLGAIGGAGVRRGTGGVGLEQAYADQPGMLVDPLDRVPIEPELADDYGGK